MGRAINRKAMWWCLSLGLGIAIVYFVFDVGRYTETASEKEFKHRLDSLIASNKHTQGIPMNQLTTFRWDIFCIIDTGYNSALPLEYYYIDVQTLQQFAGDAYTKKHSWKAFDPETMVAVSDKHFSWMNIQPYTGLIFINKKEIVQVFRMEGWLYGKTAHQEGICHRYGDNINIYPMIYETSNPTAKKLKFK